jgi:hypothetical protein
MSYQARNVPGLKPEHPEPPEFSEVADSLKPHVLAFGPTQAGKRRPSVLERISGQSPWRGRGRSRRPQHVTVTRPSA